MGSIYGWLDPSGQMHECDILGHVKLLEKLSIGKSIVEAVKQEILDATRACEELEQLEGRIHAEWHVVEILESDFLYNVYEGAYEVGFLRVGSIGSELHFEGRRKFFTKQYQICKELADYHDRRCVFVPRESE